MTTKHSPHILVVDDEPDLLTLYELALLREGYRVTTATCVQEASQVLRQRVCDVLVTDMRLPDGSGLELLSLQSELGRGEPSIVITAYGSAESAVQALKKGAFDYMTKPVDLTRLRSVVRDAVSASKHHIPLIGQRTEAAGGVGVSQKSNPVTATHLIDGIDGQLDALCGSSPAIDMVRQRVRKVAVSMAPVLLRGESGTGKELVARALHGCSHRHQGPFVAVNCGAIPETLLEAEFFGSKKGAYSGAQQDRDGFFKVASGGTLFLDEIGDLPLSMQSKLLRALQERCVRPLGSSVEVPVDVRVISATHKHLDQEVTAGRFRQDLFYRLNVIEVQLPALRERLSDLPELVDVLLKRIASFSGTTRALQLSSSAMDQLMRYDFPGNVRELENLLHRAYALSEGPELELEMPSASLQPYRAVEEAVVPAHEEDRPSQDAAHEFIPDKLEDYLDQQERRILLKVLTDMEFNRTAAAARLGISLRQIRYRMERLHIQVPVSRETDGADISRKSDGIDQH